MANLVTLHTQCLALGCDDSVTLCPQTETSAAATDMAGTARPQLLLGEVGVDGDVDVALQRL
jgi:hypothetical protein